MLSLLTDISGSRPSNISASVFTGSSKYPIGFAMVPPVKAEDVTLEVPKKPPLPLLLLSKGFEALTSYELKHRHTHCCFSYTLKLNCLNNPSMINICTSSFR
jgi:hypothetical protein